MIHETAGTRRNSTPVPGPFQVFEDLHAHLATVMGNEGYRALLSRALALAAKEVPAMRAVHMTAAGTLEGWEQTKSPTHPDEWTEGGIALLAQLLGLLAAFIGGGLTLRVTSEVWPGFSFTDSDFNDQGNYEKAK